MRGGFEQALANLRRHRIRVYGTFIFGYDGDTPESFATDRRVRATSTASTSRLSTTSRPSPARRSTSAWSPRDGCLYEAWWLDDRYSYNRIPFQPHAMTPEALQRNCLAARAHVLLVARASPGAAWMT